MASFSIFTFCGLRYSLVRIVNIHLIATGSFGIVHDRVGKLYKGAQRIPFAIRHKTNAQRQIVKMVCLKAFSYAFCDDLCLFLIRLGQYYGELIATVTKRDINRISCAFSYHARQRFQYTVALQMATRVVIGLEIVYIK